MQQYLLGFDVGGTKIEAALVERDGSHLKILSRQRIPTEREKGYESILGKIRLLTDEVKKSLPARSELLGVGLGLPGTIDPVSFRMLNGNTNAFVGHDIKSDFEDLFFDVERVECANDANCFALAETLNGVGPRHAKETGKPVSEQLSIGVILGTGCGAGVIYQGKMIWGRSGGAGEMGHSLLVSEGRECFCGRRGCAELYVSGTGLELEYAEISGRSRKEFKGADVFRLAESGEPEAQKAVTNYCGHLAAFLANMTNVMDPDYFVLGGGVSLQPVIYKGLRESVKGDLFLPMEPPEIYQHSLGDSAGVLGAALLPTLRL